MILLDLIFELDFRFYKFRNSRLDTVAKNFTHIVTCVQLISMFIFYCKLIEKPFHINILNVDKE